MSKIKTLIESVRHTIDQGIPNSGGVFGNRYIRSCAHNFIDSGAHSLYNEHVLTQDGRDWSKRYAYYDTAEFKQYLDDYAAWIKEQGNGIDTYATVDVIYNAEKSWESFRYLQDKHGLNPVPVVHERTPLEWIDKYIESGCDYIGVGGLGQESSFRTYTAWADKLFAHICPKSNNYLPIVKIHGFALTAFDLMKRYPWYSVDSASWAKAAAFGMVYVAHKRSGEFTLDVSPYFINASFMSTDIKAKRENHYYNLSFGEKQVVNEWFDLLDIPVGKVKNGKITERGFTTHYGTRAVANIILFHLFAKSLPEWPWAFKLKTSQGAFFP